MEMMVICIISSAEIVVSSLALALIMRVVLECTVGFLPICGSGL